MAIWLASCRYAGAATKGSSVHSQKTVSSPRQRICASRWRLALSKQARRAPHQDADHYEVDEKGPQPGKIIFARHVADAEHRGGGERAADRAQAADRDDDQHVDEVSEGEGMVKADHLDGERAAQPRQSAAEGEGDGERAVDVDAQAARHALVVDRSRDEHDADREKTLIEIGGAIQTPVKSSIQNN